MRLILGMFGSLVGLRAGWCGVGHVCAGLRLGCGWVPRVRLYPFLGSSSWSACKNDVAEAVTMVCSALLSAFCELSAEKHLPSRCTRADPMRAQGKFFFSFSRGKVALSILI